MTTPSGWLSLEIPVSVVVGTGVSTVLLASALAYVLLLSTTSSKDSSTSATTTRTTTKKKSGTSSALSSSSGGVNRAKYPGGELFIYYATQTGTAESFGRQLEREAAGKGFQAHLYDVENIANVNEIQSPCVILAATYGEGEPTDNARTMVDLLKEAANLSSVLEPYFSSSAEDGAETPYQNVPPLLLFQTIEYCVFGLGNKQYDHFNAMAKFFHFCFSTLGAKSIIDLFLGDDDADLEADFETWKEKHFWPTLQKKYITTTTTTITAKTEQTTTSKEDELPESPFVVEYLKDDGAAAVSGNHPEDLVIHPSSRPYFEAVSVPVTLVRELRSPEAEGSTVHVELDISSLSSSPGCCYYQTADNLAVLPVNSVEHVECVASRLGYDLNAVFCVSAADGKEWHGAPFPMPCTVRTMLSQYCDLTGPPRRSQLNLLSRYATTKTDRQFLQRLASSTTSKSSTSEYQTKVLDNYYGLVHFVQKCPSLNIPLEHFIDLCPRLQPRYFTIASSNLVYPKSIHLTVAVAQAKRPPSQSSSLNNNDNTNKDDMFYGVCSSYLAGQKQQQRRQSSSSSQPQQPLHLPTTTTMIRVLVRPSSFRLPMDPSKPIILIGPGTGVAPMRALLQEREYQKHVLQLPVGPTILYFGCRRSTHDYLYQDEFQNYLHPPSSSNSSSPTLTELHVAFSREEEESDNNANNSNPIRRKKNYVQQLLLQQAKKTAHYIHDLGAYIYVCGGVQMGHDVQQTLQTILVQQSIVGVVAADNSNNNNTATGNDNNGAAAVSSGEAAAAKDYLDRMAKQGRYVQELWA